LVGIGYGVKELIVYIQTKILTNMGTNILSLIYLYLYKHMVTGKAIPVTGREGPYGCETSRLPHFLDNRLTDGGEVVSPTVALYPQEDSWYSFLLEAESTPGP
jgi:hypothetical protein